MKANVLYNINDLRYEDVAMPEPKSGEVLVNVRACGICGSDVNRVFKTGTYHFPTIIGHEFAGEVKIDARWPKWSGKRVGVFPLKPCFECANCCDGNYEMCTHYDYLGSRCDGGFAEYVSVPEWNLIEMPDGVDFDEAAMLEPSSVALHALSRVNSLEHKNVAIIGPGTIGNIACQLAKIKGASSVTMIGRTQQKLDYALAHSADNVINSCTENIGKRVAAITNGLGFDVVIEGTGANQSLIFAIEIARSGGDIILLGNPQGDFRLDKQVYWQIMRRQLTLHGTWNSSFGVKHNDWKYVLQLISEGKLSLKSLITHRLEFGDLLKGLEIMRDTSVYSNKVMLLNHE